jgi:hypothetical protein
MAEHVSAPVSRSGGERYAMGDYEPTEGSIRLTAEERDIAARSGISETEYGRQKLKMQKNEKVRASQGLNLSGGGDYAAIRLRLPPLPVAWWRLYTLSSSGCASEQSQRQVPRVAEARRICMPCGR